MNKPVNKSAYLFLVCMKYILQHAEFTLTDLLIHLSQEHNIIISKATILKHIRTMKAVGFYFEKNNSKVYRLIATPFDITFPKENESIILETCKILKNHYLAKNYNCLEIFSKLSKFISNDKVKKYLNKKTKRKSKTLETYCLDKQRLNIEYSYNGKKLQSIVEPYEIVGERKKIYMKCYDLNKKESIFIDQNSVNSIKQLPVKNKFSFRDNHVTLKMYGSFIKSYTLKKNEKIIYSSNEYSVIESCYQDKIIFFNNLLRYMEKCEIISPLTLREEYKAFITDLYKLYE